MSRHFGVRNSRLGGWNGCFRMRKHCFELQKFNTTTWESEMSKTDSKKQSVETLKTMLGRQKIFQSKEQLTPTHKESIHFLDPSRFISLTIYCKASLSSTVKINCWSELAHRSQILLQELEETCIGLDWNEGNEWNQGNEWSKETIDPTNRFGKEKWSPQYRGFLTHIIKFEIESIKIWNSEIFKIETLLKFLSWWRGIW